MIFYSHLLTTAVLLATFLASEAIRIYSGDEVTRELRAAPSPTPAQPPVQQINYRPYSQVPESIKQLLQFQQAREPLVHIPVQAPSQLAKAPTSGSPQYQPQVQYAGQSQGQSGSRYQQEPQAAYQQQQSQQYQRAPQQIQPAYNPAGNSRGLFNPQQFQHPQNPQAQPHGSPGNVFNPEQRRLY